MNRHVHGTSRTPRLRRRRSYRLPSALLFALAACFQDAPPTGPRHTPLALAITSTSADVVLVGAGNTARCDKQNDEATAAILDSIPGTVFALGDNIYSSGSATEFTTCYDPSWGRHKGRTRPAAGDK